MMQSNNIESVSKEKNKGHQIFQKTASWFGRIYSTELNPLYNLGGIAVLMFTIACISGIYIFIFYNINPRQAWDSVEAMSGSFFNGWMRNIHRYSSDLLVVFIVLHLIHTLFTSKFKRLVSWISGVISFLIVITIGVTGFILVWDQKAKLTGYLTAKLFSGLPIFDPSIMGAFLLNDLNVVGGFFKVALFGHIALSLITVIVIWIHVLRIAKPKIFPPKKLILYSFIAIAIIAALFPVKSDPPAQLTNLPAATTFDWFYYFGYYLMKIFSVGENWAILIGSGLILCVIPFLIKRKNRTPVQIDLDKCDACNLCSYDCPYGAIDMLIHNGERKAILSPDKCVGCTICIGSCKEHAITHSEFPDFDLQPAQINDVTVFTCSFFPETNFPKELNVKQYKVPCLGSVMVKDVQQMLDNNTNKVAFLGCEDCYYRYGKTWAINRLLQKRPPAISKRYNASRLSLFTLNQYTPEGLLKFVKETETNNNQEKTQIVDYHKVKPVVATIMLTAFFALIIPFTNTKVRFFNPNDKTLVVNFKYVSSPVEYEQNVSSMKHMQSATPVVKKRSSVVLKIYASKTKKILFEKQYTPRGLRHDIAMFIFNQMNVQEDLVDIELQETEGEKKTLALNNVNVKQGDGTFVILRDGKLEVAQKTDN
ncbi:MAG: cytochrome b N-terminal domain-containing protein [Bacteroidetes bacterium]|nr:cytochrome b N-terminal domain-containing protein [Bacteroidota bacterium]MBS1670834.1 cytochrome b N-terminal domain-containing protein [Bacteroidota bacterium]